MSVHGHRCARCGFRTTHVDTIQSHMRTHTEKKPITITVIAKVNGTTTGIDTISVTDGSTITIEQAVELQPILSGKTTLT